MPTTPVFSMDRVRKTFRAGVPGCAAVARVLDGIVLDVWPGDRVEITGSTGAGKTTLLLCAAGLMSVDAGTILWRGQRLADSDLALHARYVERAFDPELHRLYRTRSSSGRRLLLIDEPFTAVSPALRCERSALLDAMRARGDAVVIATAREAQVHRASVRYLRLVGGRLCDVARVRQQSGVVRVAEASASVDPHFQRA